MAKTDLSTPDLFASTQVTQDMSATVEPTAAASSGHGSGDGNNRPVLPLSDGEDRGNLHEIAQTRYLNYALSVITSRALPDVRDGMKPVHRRIIYTMWQNGLRSDAKHRKCATVVGDVMGRYHPHGDGSIYEA